MEEFKKLVANSIYIALDKKVNEDEIIEKVEIPKDKGNNDFAYPCFN